LHHSIPLLLNITAALVAAFIGGLIARHLKLPPMVGYLAAGVAIGPFTPGFVGDSETIQQLAELGVVFLMFGVGLHFSLRDLWRVRDTAIPGAIGQILMATAAGFGLTQLWGWSVSASLVLGLAISTASTVVLLRGLMDEGLLNTSHGQVAVGWLVLEDIACVVILVLLPMLFGVDGNASWATVAVGLLKAAAFVGLMLVAGARFAPWLLTRIAHARSRELFILAVVAIALGTAVGSAELFGVSLALGAFLAGVVLGESNLSHQVGADVLPFRETFAVLFFVAVGMLVNIQYLIENAGHVLALVVLIIAGKYLFTVFLGMLLPRPAHTILVVCAGLSQIGEFAFIVGQAGVKLGILTQDQYSLILAGALFSIMLNPWMFRTIPWVESRLRRIRWFWRLLDRHREKPQPPPDTLAHHVVVVGYGRVGRHVVTVLGYLGIPRLVVELDTRHIAALRKNGVPALYGDAANSEVLTHTRLEKARALVVTVAEESAAEIIVAAARQLSPELPVIVRAATHAGMERLVKLGARDVIHPELEGGVEVLRHTLVTLGYPALEAQQYADGVRRAQYHSAFSAGIGRQVCDRLMRIVPGMDVAWVTLDDACPVLGMTLADAGIREQTGASVVAVWRGQQVIANPEADTVLRAGDMLGVLGEKAHIEAACRLLAGEKALEAHPSDPPMASAPV